MADKQVPCYLGILPPELIDNVLVYVGSLRDLRNFVLTAAFIYQRFKQRKRITIFRVLQNELGMVLTDARFLYLFPSCDPGWSPLQQDGYWDHLHTMAGVYRNMLNTREDNNIPLPDMEELLHLCYTLYDMNFLVSVYQSAAQSWFHGSDLATLPFSRVERLRIIRAFYRRQIICNAWAPTRHEPRWTDGDVAAFGNTTDLQGVQLGLFSAFEPWELQQIDHIDRFIMSQCKTYCIARGDSWQINVPKFGEISSHVSHLVDFMCEGPEIPDQTLYDAALLSNFSLNDKYDECVERHQLPCLGSDWQRRRFSLFPDPVRDRYEQEGDDNGATINFAGDAVDLPSFGWIDATSGHYINWFGDALLDTGRRAPVPYDEETYPPRSHKLQTWRDTGFTFWDQKRVQALKMKRNELGASEVYQTGWII
ncbi:hypothetical protein F4678DRAFT_420124 [Xylaria arbuscula]|nr:hypothetical protein F4678DRAFT_420124 [Xylaria arbuscula]